MAQTGILFNRTEHDFGTIGPAATAYEQDFLFRNTTNEVAHVLSVRSVNPALDFIFTRSEVLGGEYGFVKAKFNTSGVDGLFHDEIYVMLQVGEEVVNEVIYVRAQVDPSLSASNDRVFQDSEVAVSVEVSPEDIETMEGFMGGDRLAMAQSEISYLKQQMALKSDLIERLSSDLYAKKDQEAKNIQRLEELEAAVRTGSTISQDQIISQISILTKQLKSIQASDERLRQEILAQENNYKRLQHEADSARAYAQQLSRQLQDQFKQQAAAMEKNKQLEKDLANKSLLEQRQQAQIDSLEQLIAAQSSTGSGADHIISQLKSELDKKRRQQRQIESERNRQEQKISQLRQERESLIAQTDSLHANLDLRSRENATLQSQLNATSQRMLAYERMIDSLEQVSYAGITDQSQLATIDSLNRLMDELAAKDELLKSAITSKNQEIAQLESEQQKTKKDLRQLELATSRQLEETHSLMHRVNALSAKESQARLEINALQGELAGSKQREAAAKASLQTLESSIHEKQASIAAMQDSMSIKNAALASLQQNQEALTMELNKARQHMQYSARVIDSLQQVADGAADKKASLESTIADLKRAITLAEQEERQYRAQVDELNAKLTNARMSNDIVFQELKADVEAMRDERDEYRNDNRALVNENLQLKKQLAEQKQLTNMAELTIKEISSSDAIKACYRISILVEEQLPLSLPKAPTGQSWTVYPTAGKLTLCIGSYSKLSEAVNAKKYWQNNGYPKASVVGDKDGKLVSLKEVMETAMVTPN